MKDVAVRLPSEVIIEILRRVPRWKLKKLQTVLKKEVKSVPAGQLLNLTGIASIGGDALSDTERVWENE